MYGIVLVVGYLYVCGIMYGDLYVYNILYDGVGGVLFGDFGVVLLYDLNECMCDVRFEWFEVCVFGYLFGELFECCGLYVDVFDVLVVVCVNEDVDVWLLFDEIMVVLVECMC